LTWVQLDERNCRPLPTFSGSVSFRFDKRANSVPGCVQSEPVTCGNFLFEGFFEMAIKVMIADDHEVVRHGLAALFQGTDLKVVAEATTGNEVVTMAKKHKPDVVLLDVRMPGLDGLEALEKLRKDLPNMHVVVLSTYDNPTYVARAVALGASDYVLKG